MKKLLTILLLGLLPAIAFGIAPDPGQEYIEAWKRFYPSRALSQGMHASIFDFEDRSPEAVSEWLAFNRRMLGLLDDPALSYRAAQPIDARLLRLQVRKEIERWEREAPHRHSLTHYAELIAGAMDPVLSAAFLTAPERSRLACERLESVRQLCAAARVSLGAVDREDLDRGLAVLAAARSFYESEIAGRQELGLRCPRFSGSCREVADVIQTLAAYAEAKLLPAARPASSLLGRDEFARRLTLYTDSPLTPEALAAMARQEIEEAKAMMLQVATSYLQKQYPDRSLPESEEALLRFALDDMEKDAPRDGAEYLRFWQELAAAAAAFVEEQQIATLPELQTLRIVHAPESAGPAARIGWVDSASPFAPNPVTTLYLPSIPDTLPEAERKDFWASFNKPFNRMIVIHELFPGHYLQIKVSRESPHPLRLLFPYEPYFEGWATFTERVCLDAGWEKDDPLTFLAHLRKRVENANRAYTSVQVHCNGWNEEQVMRFSTETSLLAPQFARSLWGRIMRSPLQLTSYFWGGRQFTELLTAERQRQGEDFRLKDFMDTIMQAGPIPIDEFPGIFNSIAAE